LNQIKDMYAQREREGENRHRDEIREIKTEHAAEIEKVRQESNDRVENIQGEVQSKLSAKDLQNRKEVEAIRSMYQKRLAELKTQKD
jgi:hypothetical protein